MQDLPAPRWAPDPFRRHELRYWDGQRWTEHVSDDLVVGTDAPVGPAEPRVRRPQVVDLASADLWDDLEAASVSAPRGRRALRESGHVPGRAPVAPGSGAAVTGGSDAPDRPEPTPVDDADDVPAGAVPDVRDAAPRTWDGPVVHASPVAAIPPQNPPAGSTPAEIPTGRRSLSAVEIAGSPNDPHDRVPTIVRLSRESLLPEIAAALVVVLLVAGAALVARSGATRPTAEDAVAAVVRSAEPDAGASVSPTKKKKVSGPKVSKPPKRVVVQAPAPTEPTRTATTTKTKKTTRPPDPTTTSEKPTEEPTSEEPTSEEPTTDPPSDEETNPPPPAED